MGQAPSMTKVSPTRQLRVVSPIIKIKKPNGVKLAYGCNTASKTTKGPSFDPVPCSEGSSQQYMFPNLSSPVICATILLRGMWCKQCILNAPFQSFEQSMSGYGMQVKYLMAGFLAIYALTMLIQFTSFFMSNSSKLLKTKLN